MAGPTAGPCILCGEPHSPGEPCDAVGAVSDLEPSRGVAPAIVRSLRTAGFAVSFMAERGDLMIFAEVEGSIDDGAKALLREVERMTGRKVP